MKIVWDSDLQPEATALMNGLIEALRERGYIVNINQFMPDRSDVPELSHQTLAQLLELRKATFTGFASIEQEKGLIRPSASLNSSHGQEMLRLLMFRVIEECVESMNSTDPAHIKEEAIDAINYAWAIFVLDGSRYNPDMVVSLLYRCFTEPAQTTRLTWTMTYPRQHLTVEDVGEVASWLAGDVGDLMRNRAWMNNSQDIYFTGTDMLALALARVTAMLYTLFKDWQEFCAYYLAKDAVLQFRLKSRY